MTRILIAEDHHLVRQGIRALLEMQPGFEVVGEAQDGREAIAFLTLKNPDLVILDINMPEISGLEVLKIIQQKNLSVRALILSMYSDEGLISQAIRLGARGYLLKRSVTEELIEAIQKIAEGHIFLSSAIQDEIDVQALLNENTAKKLYALDTLTVREIEVLRMIADGKTNYNISIILGISSKTVEKHRANLMKKMDVQDLAGLIQKGIKLGFIYLER
ncbi:MAG: response regulator transcription factor [Anaerolineae bacterium]|nr:response regulator transcription factor [Anaerolineae bacterium]